MKVGDDDDRGRRRRRASRRAPEAHQPDPDAGKERSDTPRPVYGRGPELERGPGAPSVRGRYDDMTDQAAARRDRARGGDAVDHLAREPRGWRRSDARICEDVSVALARDPGIDACDIEVRVEESEVMLTGTVADKFARRLAGDIAESVFGVTEVQNLLRVRRDGDGMEASSGRRGDREVKLPAEREGGPSAPPAPATRRRKNPPSSPESRVD
jgi:BON domain